jgi:hypothetical protein
MEVIIATEHIEMADGGKAPAGNPARWWRKGMKLVLWPFIFPPILFLLIIVAGLSIPFAFAMWGIQSIGERQFRRLMRDRGRFVEWSDLSPELGTGAGALIIEQGQKCPVRIWWTPDDVISRAPCAPPSEEELDIFLRNDPHEFVVWCCHRYTDETSGTAKLTVPSLELPPGLFFAKFFKERFPLISAIDTVYRGPRKAGATEV